MFETSTGANRSTVDKRVLTSAEAAEYLGLKPITLDVWRQYGKGPEYIKMGRAVRYRKEDLDRFMDKNRRRSTCEDGGNITCMACACGFDHD